ncbi:MAG: hypothetical protein JWO35_347 [Candidatus Saccharibacteria bacterium]|nr:hypothetical protein [Candidatus Saccharibacteria bacterium]
MIAALKSLETKLEDLFVKQAPPLPPNGKKAIVQYLPWINLVVGVLTLFAAYGLWHAAHYVNRLADYANSLSAAYGGDTVSTSGLTITVWLGVAVLLAEAAIFIAAFPATRDRKKSGWDLMFYGVLINVVYGVVSLFTNYGGIGNLVGAIIGSVIGFYFLFQIRASYLKQPVVAKKA